MVLGSPDLCIESDASLTGWGACILPGRRSLVTGGDTAPHQLPGASGSKNIHEGPEAKASTASTGQHNCCSQYQRGTVSAQATTIAREVWMWCLESETILSAQHLPGKDNTTTDQEAREMKDHSDWMLTQTVFLRIVDHFPNLNVDLFACHLTFQLPRFFSWRPNPMAEAFIQDWNTVRQPPTESDREGTFHNGGTRGRGGACSMALETMVPKNFSVC